MQIYLNSVDRVKRFVDTASKYECDIDLVSGRFVIDGKSLLGIFSLDLSKPLEVMVTDEDLKEKFFNEIKKYETKAKVSAKAA